MQNRGMKIVHVNALVDRIPAKLIGGTIREAATHATTGEPHGESKRMMIPTVGVTLARRGAAEFTPPDHKRIFQQATRLQIGQQARDGQIGGGRVFRDRLKL